MHRLFFLLICYCGLEYAHTAGLPSTTIVGGRPALQGEIPYILSLQINKQHSCGASLIEVNKTILAISAAHCTVYLTGNENITLVAGELSLSNSSGSEQVLQISKIVNHEWNMNTKENDICLIFLETEVNLNENIRVISLPLPGSTPTSGQIQVSGWGLTSERDFTPSDILMTVDIPFVNDTVCREAYGNLVDSMLCAGKIGEGGVDSCQMDSGGPAVQNGTLVGIVSFGNGCARVDYPGVYTEVSYFLDWIHQTVVDNI